MLYRNLLAVVLWVLAASQQSTAEDLDEFLRGRAAEFPLVAMERTNQEFAKVHVLEGPDKSVKFGDRHYSAFRVTMPPWLDGSLSWLFAFSGPDTPNTRKLLWFIVPEEDDGTKFTPNRSRWGGDERFPKFCELFPGCESFHQQHIPREQLKPGKTYIIWISFPEKQRSEIRFSLTVRSERGLKECGLLPTGNPHMGPALVPHGAPAPKPKPPVQTAKEAASLFSKSGATPALAMLEKDLAAFLATGARFHDFYLAVWREAQTGTGRVATEWAATAYGWLQQKCIDLGAFTFAEEIVANTSSTMIQANWYGAARQSLTPFLKGMARREISLDPRSLEDLGPAIESLPEVRLRKVPVMAKRKAAVIDVDGSVRSSPDLPRRFDGSMISMASLEFLGGDWKTAIERYLWVCSWAEAVRGKQFEVEAGWYGARAGLADTLLHLGLLEAADAEYATILGKDWIDVYQNRSRHLARHRQIDIKIRLGANHEALLAELDELRTTLEKHPFVSRYSWEAVEITKAKCLAGLGRTDEADTLLSKLVEGNNHTARFERIRQRLAAGRMDKLETELLTVLGNYRDWGRKIDEAAVYSLYADFLEKTGRLNESISMRREAIRLMKSFDLFVALPEELARLSLSLARCGDGPGAKGASDEAMKLAGKSDRIPLRVAARVKDMIAASPGPAAAGSPPVKRPPVGLQPGRSLVIPVAGMPARGRLTLSNPGDQVVEGLLAFDGIAADATWDESTAKVRLGASGESRLKVRVDPGSYVLVELVSGDPAPVGELTVTWTSRGQPDENSIWTFEEAEEGVTKAVIEAGEFRLNAFYGIPIHHHYQHAGRDQEQVGLRVIASSPARIEFYDAADRAVFVDDNGNGNLSDPRDSLFQDSDSDGQPDISLEAGESSIRMHVFPTGEIPADGLKLRLEALIDGAWVSVAEDRITR